MTASTGSRSSRSNLEWLARSMGFVDKVCCYSYAKEQIHEEDLIFASSYESDDTSCCAAWRDSASIKKTSKRDKSTSFKQPLRNQISTTFPNSPGRSMETATTVTTSTCTTIPTSVKQCFFMEAHDQRAPPRQPREISIPQFDRSVSIQDMENDSPAMIRPKHSSSLPSIRFYTATEGYEG
jgi:hypothetical protein